ncbi:MAG: hypothetical protein FJ306_14650 [Planctomycetes bacterium]|nr:hypothetical protein [Planctomycetota bacterium]
MRASLVVFALVLVVALGFWLGGAPAPVTPPDAGGGATAPAPMPTPAPAQGGNRTEVDAPAPPLATAPPPVAPAPPTPPANAAEPNVLLTVRDMVSRQPLAAFRWRFQNSRGTWKGDGADGKAALALEASAVGTLLVEADGLQPLTKDGVIVPTPPAAALTLDLFLAPQGEATGITLMVHDLGLQPLARVRVDAFQLADPQAADWHLGPSLWARMAENKDGRYALPPLEPASYGLQVVAVDGNGEPLPLLPYRRVFEVTGSNGFVDDVPLEPGALLGLEIVDSAGQGFDPAKHGTTRLSLHFAGAPHVARKWVARQGTAAATAVDVLPGIGRAELATGAPPGPYELEVTVQGALRTKQPLFLRPGIKNEERIVVP